MDEAVVRRSLLWPRHLIAFLIGAVELLVLIIMF